MSSEKKVSLGDWGNYDKDERIVDRFLSVIGTNQIIILSGPSGTGKTMLPRMAAQVISKDKKYCSVIPVQSNWTDEQDIFGYYNFVEQKYVPTQFTEAVISAKMEPDKLHFIVIDEMNLSHVEYYFAKYLSAMETADENNNISFHLDNGDRLNEYIKERFIEKLVEICRSVIKPKTDDQSTSKDSGDGEEEKGDDDKSGIKKDPNENEEICAAKESGDTEVADEYADVFKDFQNIFDEDNKENFEGKFKELYDKWEKEEGNSLEELLDKTDLLIKLFENSNLGTEFSGNHNYNSWKKGYNLLKNEISVKDDPSEIIIPANVQIVGTMNMDETTKGISPKVIDRSYVIEITGKAGSKSEEKKEKGTGETESSKNDVCGFYLSGDDTSNNAKEIKEHIEKFIEDFNKIDNNPLNLKFSKRQTKKLERMVDVIEGKTSGESNHVKQKWFEDDFVLSKILPAVTVTAKKVEREKNKECLSAIEKICKNYGYTNTLNKINKMYSEDMETYDFWE